MKSLLSSNDAKVMDEMSNNKAELNNEINETEELVDFADGDGVNEFDDTVNSMSEGEDFIDYSSSDLESEEKKVSSNLTTDENVDDVLASLSEEEEIKFVPKSDGV